MSSHKPPAPGFGELVHVHRTDDYARAETVKALRRVADLLEAGAEQVSGGIVFSERPEDPTVVRIGSDLVVRIAP